jgi:SAM-dependent methyltransferase
MDRHDRSDTEQQTEQLDRREEYLLEGNVTARQAMSWRTAAKEGSFFLPHLRPGMDVLDCACGPGSITIGLPEAVQPGLVTGIDVDEVAIEIARSVTREQGVDNIRYETGSAYALPYDAASFDAVFAHALLEHLSEPLEALAEMKRVLRPGGLVGIRSTDLDHILMEPEDPTLLRANELRIRVQRHKGGDPGVGKHFRAMLHDAGFTRIRATASYDSYGDPERIQQLKVFMVHDGERGDQLIEFGWADRETLTEIAEAWRKWAEKPGAFSARSWCEAIGWKE